MVTPLIILALLLFPLLFAWVYALAYQRCFNAHYSLITGLCMAFLFFALGHFIKTAGMVEMMPAWIPQREMLVYLSGAWEVLIALGLMTKRFRRIALIAAASTLVSFFPFNIYAAFNQLGLGGHQWGPVYLLIRGPVQIVLLAWCLWALSMDGKTPITPLPAFSSAPGSSAGSPRQ